MSSLYSEVILDHFRNPRNYGSLPSPDVAYEDVNPLCGDRIRIELEIRDGVVRAARFKGDGCAISIAAASILTELIIGRELDQTDGIPAENLLSALNAEIRPSRMKCALLPLEVLRSSLKTGGNSVRSPLKDFSYPDQRLSEPVDLLVKIVESE
jgi:nitrogen fixation NifU-like protein